MISRRLFVVGTGAVAAPHVAHAVAPRRWRLATSWARNLPGPGVTATRLARRITELSDGALSIDLFAAGEIVPAFGVFDAVSSGTVEMGHTAALFWGGKMPAAPLFTTVPFGLAPAAHAGWLDADGQGLWDQLYKPFGVKPLLAGNTGPSSAGWFRKQVLSLGDMAGLRIRVAGLGGEIYRRLGATPFTLSPSETYPALERGTIDAAEFLAPANDLALGLHHVAPHLAFPGFGKPNGASELLIGLQHWRTLSPRLQAIVSMAARAEHDAGLADAARSNAAALRVLIAEGASIFRLPADVLDRAQHFATEMLNRIRDHDLVSAAIVDSYRAQAGVEARAWDRLTRI